MKNFFKRVKRLFSKEIILFGDKPVSTEKNQFILGNLDRAIRLIESIPQEKISLYAFKQETSDCGTLFCAAGHLAQDPYFIGLGMKLQLFGKTWIVISTNDNSSDDNLSNLFGPWAFDTLFARYGEGRRDKSSTDLYRLSLGSDYHRTFKKHMSDKALSLARLRLQRDEIVSQLNGE